jgi:predicted nucleotidyltransferase
MKLEDLLAPLNELFRREQIRYAVIGGYAVAAWGEVRATRDIDLLCRAVDLGSLVAALAKADIRFERRTGDLDDPVSEVVKIDVTSESGAYEIDVLAGIRGAPAGIVERARQVTLEGLVLPVASPEDTVVLKLLAGSRRDIDDAISIIRLQTGRLDLALLRDLCPPDLRSTLESLLLD